MILLGAWWEVLTSGEGKGGFLAFKLRGFRCGCYAMVFLLRPAGFQIAVYVPWSCLGDWMGLDWDVDVVEINSHAMASEWILHILCLNVKEAKDCK